MKGLQINWDLTTLGTLPKWGKSAIVISSIYFIWSQSQNEKKYFLSNHNSRSRRECPAPPLSRTVASKTVISSSFPPRTSWNPLERALRAKGDKKSGSCDNFRAINAMLFAHAWIWAGSVDPWMVLKTYWTKIVHRDGNSHNFLRQIR